MHPPTHATRTALAAIVGLLLLAGCSDPAPAPGPAPSTGTVASSGPTATAPSSSAAASPSSSAATTGAARPTPGGDGSVEPSRAVQTAEPKRLDEPTRSAGAEVSLASVRAASIKATDQLDRSGPGVLVRLKVENTSGKTLDTSFVQVAASNAAGAPGTLLNGRPTDPLPASVRAGASAEGTYAFLLDDATSRPITVLVYVTSGEPVLQFRGRAG